MNSSSSTKATLNSNSADMTPSYAGKLTLGRFLFALVLTVVVFSTLVKLGFWQWERGEQKQGLEQQLQRRQAAQPVPFHSLVLHNPSGDEASYYRWTGVPVQAQVRPLKTLFYMDNQVFEGKVGYLALQLVEVKSAGMALVELGFVASMQDRTQLPLVTGLVLPEADVLINQLNGQVSEQASQQNSGLLDITGRLYSKQHNSMSVQSIEAFGIDAKAYQVFRVQTLDMGSLSQLIGQPITPWVIQPTDNSSALPHPWKPVNMHSSKHFAYAFQWFAMALVLAVLVGYCAIKGWNLVRRRRGK